LRLGFIMVLTSDLAEAERFYREVLGLTLTGRTPNQLVFDLAGTEFRVFQCEEPAQARVHAASSATVCIFEVADLDVEMRRMRDLGAAFIHQTPAQGPDGAFRYAAFHAPGGNVHELMERRVAG
jgi:catechol 2,3-dioxygenase-like lactoylglutathione lyase family enzyme